MSLPLVTACDDDEATDPYDINYVYIYKPSETNATLEIIKETELFERNRHRTYLSPIRCTKPAPQDLTIQLAIDRSLVDAYNSEYGTSPYVGFTKCRTGKCNFVYKTRGIYLCRYFKSAAILIWKNLRTDRKIIFSQVL